MGKTAESKLNWRNLAYGASDYYGRVFHPALIVLRIRQVTLRHVDEN